MSILGPSRGRGGVVALALFILVIGGWSPAKRAWILAKGVPVEARIENVTCGNFTLGCTAWFTYTGSDGKTTRGLSEVLGRSRPVSAQARYLPGHENDLTTAAELVDDGGHMWLMLLLGSVFVLFVGLKADWRSPGQ